MVGMVGMMIKTLKQDAEDQVQLDCKLLEQQPTLSIYM